MIVKDKFFMQEDYSHEKVSHWVGHTDEVSRPWILRVCFVPKIWKEDEIIGQQQLQPTLFEFQTHSRWY